MSNITSIPSNTVITNAEHGWCTFDNVKSIGDNVVIDVDCDLTFNSVKSIGSNVKIKCNELILNVYSLPDDIAFDCNVLNIVVYQGTHKTIKDLTIDSSKSTRFNVKSQLKLAGIKLIGKTYIDNDNLFIHGGEFYLDDDSFIKCETIHSKCIIIGNDVKINCIDRIALTNLERVDTNASFIAPRVELNNTSYIGEDVHIGYDAERGDNECILGINNIIICNNDLANVTIDLVKIHSNPYILPEYVVDNRVRRVEFGYKVDVMPDNFPKIPKCDMIIRNANLLLDKNFPKLVDGDVFVEHYVENKVGIELLGPTWSPNYVMPAAFELNVTGDIKIETIMRDGTKLKASKEIRLIYPKGADGRLEDIDIECNRLWVDSIIIDMCFDKIKCETLSIYAVTKIRGDFNPPHFIAQIYSPRLDEVTGVFKPNCNEIYLKPSIAKSKRINIDEESLSNVNYITLPDNKSYTLLAKGFNKKDKNVPYIAKLALNYDNGNPNANEIILNNSVEIYDKNIKFVTMDDVKYVAPTCGWTRDEGMYFAMSKFVKMISDNIIEAEDANGKSIYIFTHARALSIFRDLSMAKINELKYNKQTKNEWIRLKSIINTPLSVKELMYVFQLAYKTGNHYEVNYGAIERLLSKSYSMLSIAEFIKVISEYNIKHLDSVVKKLKKELKIK